MDMNEKPKLSGVLETMLQTVYARAKETKTRGAIKDTKAVEMIFHLPIRTQQCTVALWQGQ